MRSNRLEGDSGRLNNKERGPLVEPPAPQVRPTPSQSSRLGNIERGPLIEVAPPQVKPIQPEAIRIANPQRGALADYRPPEAMRWKVDGWSGMYDTLGDQVDQDEATLLFNFMPMDTKRPGPLIMRNGRECFMRQSTAPRLGTSTFRVQWMGEVKFPSQGSPVVIAIADGEIYKIEPGTSLVTKMVTQANLATAGITFTTVTACNCVLFNGTLVVTAFNTGQPFSWNGVSGAGGLVSLTNAPAANWDVTVYYAKLFFLSADRLTIYWSEELQANTGYAAGGYNNAWKLSQSSEESINAIIGTNEALYFGRDQGVGAIRGAVSSTFQTDGVIDGIHQGSGPASPTLFAYHGGTLFWADLKGQIYASRGGSEVVTLTSQSPRIWGLTSKVDAGAYSLAPPWNVGEAQLAGMWPQLLMMDRTNDRLYAEYGTSAGGRTVWVYDTATLKLLSIWVYGSTNDQTPVSLPNRYRYASMGRTGAALNDVYLFADDTGYLFSQMVGQAVSRAATADYSDAGVATPIEGMLLGPKHGDNHNTEWAFPQIDVIALQEASTLINVGYITSRNHKTQLTPGTQGFNSADSVNDPYEHRFSFGLGKEAAGRWLRPIIKLTGNSSISGGEGPPMLLGYTLTGVPRGRNQAII